MILRPGMCARGNPNTELYAEFRHDGLPILELGKGGRMMDYTNTGLKWVWGHDQRLGGETNREIVSFCPCVLARGWFV